MEENVKHPGNRTKGENRRGNWVGGKTISSGGYIQKRCVGHPRATKLGHYVFEHILVMEKHIGRLLIKGEIVHHINGIKTDNRLENLELTTQSEHMKHHKPVASFKKGVVFSKQHRQRISRAKTEWWRLKKCNQS